MQRCFFQEDYILRMHILINETARLKPRTVARLAMHSAGTWEAAPGYCTFEGLPASQATVGWFSRHKAALGRGFLVTVSPARWHAQPGLRRSRITRRTFTRRRPLLLHHDAQDPYHLDKELSFWYKQSHYFCFYKTDKRILPNQLQSKAFKHQWKLPFVGTVTTDDDDGYYQYYLQFIHLKHTGNITETSLGSVTDCKELFYTNQEKLNTFLYFLPVVHERLLNTGSQECRSFRPRSWL